MTLFDTHCHLAGEPYVADLEAVLARAWEAGLEGVVVLGELDGDAARAVELTARHPRLRASVGVHPHHAASWSAETAARLAALAEAPGVVAVGETGLDYHYEHAPRAAQFAALHGQLELAARLGKPAVIHAREADDDVAAVLREHPKATVILHSFSSGPALLHAGLTLGAYVSFSGMVTFRNWALDDLVRAVPDDRLLVETDGPYLAPVPHRGKRNEPAWVRHTAERLAAVRGTAADTLAQQTTRNAVRVFGL